MPIINLKGKLYFILRINRHIYFTCLPFNTTIRQIPCADMNLCVIPFAFKLHLIKSLELRSSHKYVYKFQIGNFHRLHATKIEIGHQKYENMRQNQLIIHTNPSFQSAMRPIHINLTFLNIYPHLFRWCHQHSRTHSRARV